MHEAQALGQRPRGGVADDDPGGAGQALVQDLGDHADVGVGVGRDHHGRVDAGHPELGEGAV